MSEIVGDDLSVVEVGGREMPGNVIEIADADRTWEWSAVKGIASSLATTLFKGSNVCESFTVTTEVTTTEERIATEEWRKYIAPPKAGGKPATFKIKNWLINFNEIDRASIKGIACPKPTDTNSLVFVWTFTEINPKKQAATGPADPAKLTGGGKSADSELQGLQSQVAALAKQASAATK